MFVDQSELTYVDFAVFHVLDNLSTLLEEGYGLLKVVPGATLRTFYDKMYRLPVISGPMMERPMAGFGEVGKVAWLIFTQKARSRLEVFRQLWLSRIQLTCMTNG